MVFVHAHDLVVDFPIYGAQHRSLKSTVLAAAVGGALARNNNDKVVVRALDKLTFEFKAGDRVGLLGPNGSGKSTLLRVLAGAYEPVSGSIVVRGRIASMLSITLGLELEATGHENIFLLGAMMGCRKSEIQSYLEDIYNFVELGDYMHMPMRTYSSGMVMRLAFALATSVKADIVLMDEWMSVGDQNFAEKAQQRLIQLLDRAKIFFLASHNEELIRKNCNWIVRLEHGQATSIESLKWELQ